jgi:hypothetical protein
MSGLSSNARKRRVDRLTCNHLLNHMVAMPHEEFFIM